MDSAEEVKRLADKIAREILADPIVGKLIRDAYKK